MDTLAILVYICVLSTGIWVCCESIAESHGPAPLLLSEMSHNLTDRDCPSFRTEHCPEVERQCASWRFFHGCDSSATSADIQLHLAKLHSRQPKIPIFLKIRGRRNLTAQMFSPAADQIVVLEMARSTEFSTDYLVGLGLPNVLELRFYYIDALQVTKRGLLEFRAVRSIIFIYSTVVLIEREAFDNLLQLKLLAVDWIERGRGEERTSRHLRLLHCDARYEWFREFLREKPYLIQPRQAGELFYLPAMSSEYVRLRQIFHPVDCSRDDLTQVGDQYMLTNFSINAEGSYEKDSLGQEVIARNWLIGGFVTTVITVLLIASILLYIRRRRRILFWSTSQQPSTHVRYTSHDLTPQTKILEVPSSVLVKENFLLGKGEHGVVHRGKASGLHGRPGEITVAIKSTPRAGTTDWDSLIKEVNIMSSVGQHLNVVNLLGVVLEGEILLILEYCSLGSLRTYLKRLQSSHTSQEADGSSMSEEITLDRLTDYCYQIARGMEFLSSKNIVHRDLAARNVLLTDSFTAKISDFGMARETNSDYLMEISYALPVKWMPPEGLRDKIFNQKTDVWSFGITMFEIFSFGESPFAELQMHDFITLLDQGYQMSCPPNTPSSVQEIMASCWSLKPADRPTFRELRQKLQQFVDESYYLMLDRPYVEFNSQLLDQTSSTTMADTQHQLDVQ